MRRLVIDDIRVFPFECVYARTLEDGFKLIETVQEGDELWLDHDLSSLDTIRPIVTHIEQSAFEAYEYPTTKKSYPFNQIVTVTDNPVGQLWIWAALSQYYPMEHYNGPSTYLTNGVW